ncbi:hypothetical protein DdX_08816 [Ditylenchus destructor]|uniref:RNA-binding S4 domain-containing protein n=1 Tax=Ditylenchus destructor TaxID=166010 RepID=A0AAD4R734_9BILA|nr:hypothetical protein DdX_08816 [Ditylenchus destructor]
MLANLISPVKRGPATNALFLKRLFSVSTIDAAKRKSDNRNSDIRSYIKDDGLPIDYKIKRVILNHRQISIFLKHSVPSVSNKDVETMISRGNVRKNEEVIIKKTVLVDDGDEIDVWESPYEENSQLANIQRLEVLNMDMEEEGYVFTIKHTKNMLVDNWK